MTADAETLVVAAYVFAKELPSPAPSGRPPLIEDEELIALAVAQAASGICSDRQFLGMVGKLLPGWFPHLPDQTQYNRRLRSLTTRLVLVQQRLAGLLASGRLRFADGTLVGVANYAGCAAKSEFAGLAAYGYCAAKSRYYWGVRLVLLTDWRGLPTGYTLVPANEPLLIEAKLPIGDIGMVRVGQDARIQLVSAVARGFQPIKGKVVHISPDSVLDEQKMPHYRVRIAPDSNAFDHRGTRYPLMPGVPVSVAILTGERSLFGYLAGPITDGFHMAFSEP